TLVGGIRSQLKKNGVTVLEATGVIQGRDADGFHVLAGGESHTGRRLLIATGSAPVLPPIPGLREGIQSGFVLTNREILNLNQVPGDLTVIGGGVIGLEMASYFNSAGSRITVVEMLDHIAGNTDAEISEILLKNYTARGVQFALSSKVVAIKDHAVVYESASGTVEIPADKVLCSIGRKPVTEGVGLENIGVRLERGAVVTDERGRTNIPEVYAAGDVNGVWMLAHAAYREAEVCVNNMLGKRDTIRYNAIPSVIYTTPEVASAGETAATCAQKGILFDETTVSMMYSGRYVAENKAKDGICKILVEKDSRRLLGVHMIGSYASEIIYGAGILIETEMRVEDIRQLVFPHPTVSEIIREGIFRL
ncbi:MAG TPA: dihydrolipoyl dehydrogenase, partial [Clostridiales bacterium]|nr:dihydrolipoyl dehydrogenase [Clostridiales bacterium]